MWKMNWCSVERQKGGRKEGSKEDIETRSVMAAGPLLVPCWRKGSPPISPLGLPAHTCLSSQLWAYSPGKAPPLPPPPFGGAVAAESQLEVLISQWCLPACVRLTLLLPDPSGVGRLGLGEGRADCREGGKEERGEGGRRREGGREGAWERRNDNNKVFIWQPKLPKTSCTHHAH